MDGLWLPIGQLLVWPLAGSVVAAIRGIDRADPGVPFAWSAFAGFLVAGLLFVVAYSADPTTSTEGMRALGVGLLGIASGTGALLSGLAALGLRWWSRRRPPRS
ncbi:MAG: hypothetical protein KY437_02720 [Actinobacteria bacterium]|nr:hypothetical protein [Actinomycetota bacterium]